MSSNFWSILALCAIALLILSIGFGQLLGDGDVRLEAVNEGHAQYYLDENNERQWRWLPACSPTRKGAKQ